MRRPRLLVCSDTYPPQVNGVSVVTSLSVTGLITRGWDVAVAGPRYPAGVVNAFGSRGGLSDLSAHLTFPSTPLPFYPDLRLALPNVRSLARLVEEFVPDVIHCATEFVIGRMGQHAARRASIPMITSYHTDFSRYTVAYGVPWLRGPVNAHLVRFHRRAHRTLTPSAPARDDLRVMGVPAVDVWGRGVEIETFHPTRRSEALRETYNSGDGFLFLHVGRIAPEKGVEQIVAAFQLLQRRLPRQRMHLVIAGEGPRVEQVRALAGGDHHISFLGNLDRGSVLPQLYASADAFLFASLTETLGLVVLEAMSSGLPVVATPAGGVADHLRDGVNGLAFPESDVDAMSRAMERLVLDRALTATLASGARATALDLSWDHELDRLDAILRQVAGVDSDGLRRSG
ncbi:MAG TPA: glycosyltransferase family 1 protein [Gemmatimonas sp.]|nr:glycosyltransferase family 1 protein [Gemmatimonas sp.]